MAFWSGSSIININTSTPNSGTGDTLYDAFNKVDYNFSNISAQLSSVSQDWLNANVQVLFNAGSANITNLFSPNISGTNANLTSNITAVNLIATNGVYADGQSFFSSNINVGANIVPTGAGFNLGSPSRPFANLYVQNTVSTTQITQSTAAGIFQIHANITPGDVQDVGILGNISNDYASNAYVFFGHQFTTNNFIYKITPNNAATVGNSVVYDGLYGNAQFGSQFLSNSTVSTSTATGALIVAGGAGIGGNLNVGSNITAANIVASGTVYSGGYPVITPNSPGIGILYNAGTVFTQNVAININTPSSSTASGALVVTGGVGVGGNVTALGLVGAYYGQVQTAAQPYITSLGTLTGLAVTSGGTISTGTLQANNVGSSYATIGTLNVTTLSGLAALTVSGNLSAGNIISTSYGNVYGSVFGSIYGTVNGTGVYDYGTRVLSASSGNGNLTISANTINLTPVGPGAVTVGGTGNIPVITTDTYGRVVAAANITFTAPASSITLVGSSGSGTVTTGGNLTFASTNGVTIAVGSSYANISTPQDIRTTASPTFANVTAGNVIATHYGNVIASNISTANITSVSGLYTSSLVVQGNLTVVGTTTSVYNESVTGNITPGANLTYNIGSTTAWWNNIYGTAIHAQYADLAEIYVADADYEPGTVVVFGGEKEITTTMSFADTRVAGAISTNPAYLMNDSVAGLPVALRGRIPVKVIGPVTKGDSLVTSPTPGYAASVGIKTEFGQAVFAKSLVTNLDQGEKIIEAVIL